MKLPVDIIPVFRDGYQYRQRFVRNLKINSKRLNHSLLMNKPLHILVTTCPFF